MTQSLVLMSILLVSVVAIIWMKPIGDWLTRQIERPQEDPYKDVVKKSEVMKNLKK